jgi:hypothetical protein
VRSEKFAAHLVAFGSSNRNARRELTSHFWRHSDAFAFSSISRWPALIASRRERLSFEPISVWVHGAKGCPSGDAFLARLGEHAVEARLASAGDRIDFVVTLGWTQADGMTTLGSCRIADSRGACDSSLYPKELESAAQWFARSPR